jgi:multidrug resistance efflux pump
VANNLEQQLVQLDELLGLLDAKALRSAQEALEHQIAELSERLEVTRQALAQAHSQRKRLARARLLLDESTQENNTNGDPALHHKEPTVEPGDAPARTTAPFVTERRASAARRSDDERRDVEDRRSKS